jgi:condensin-2 complex subunit H2
VIQWIHLLFRFCNSLEEYLQDLIGLSGTQLAQVKTASLSAQDEAPGDIPNFAQAAIILQNSSHVYSRKVEYLHGLVYKALYEFFKSASGTSKESRQKSPDAAIDEFYDFDVNEDFLLLDDVVPEDFTKAKINLKEDDDEMDALSGSGTPANQSLTRTRLSLGGLSVTRVERSSLGGIASSSHQRALLGTLNNGSLRLIDGLCDVGQDGVLLMPGSQIATPPAPVGFARDNVETGRSLFGEEPGAPVDFQFATEGDFDDHSTGHGFALHDDDVDDGAPAMMNDGDVEIGVVAHAGHVMTKRVTFAETANKLTRDDPWALLDPHSTDGFNPKPLRKAKTYVLPKGIDLPPSECVTGASTRRVVNRSNTEIKTQAPTSIIIESLEAMLGKRKDYPGIPFSGLVFGDEFLYLAKQHANLKASQRRAERKQRLEQQESPNLRVQAEFTDDDDDDDNDGAGVDFGVGGDNDDNDNDDFGNAGLSSLDEAFEGKQAGEGRYSDFFLLSSRPIS